MTTLLGKREREREREIEREREEGVREKGGKEEVIQAGDLLKGGSVWRAFSLVSTRGGNTPPPIPFLGWALNN